MLRPNFTAQLAATLLSGQSVNLHSPHGRGRRQTLDDLHTLFPPHIHIAKIDLKRETNKWNTWLEYTVNYQGQIIVIIHNMEHLSLAQQQDIPALKGLTLLCVSEQPMRDATMQIIALPKLVEHD